MTSFDDWGPIIDEAEAQRFVGREQELDTFRQHINSTPPRYLVFYITGQGGVGKTTLLNRYREIARNDFKFLLADSDEQQRDIPSVLGRFARQLKEQNVPLKRFDERYTTYRQKMHEIENDPEAPQGLAALLGRTVVRAAFVGGDLVPGVRKGLELLPRDSLEHQASEWTSYLAKKLTNKDDVALVRDPVSILTPLFFQDLNEIAQKQKILLCFENFEATRQELQQWLLHLPEYKPSRNIRIAVAGRDEPGANWDKLRNVTMIIHLDVLTEREAEAFLDSYGVNSPQRRTEILECSGRLPVIMSWLAAPEASEPDISLPTHNIVERFLRWVSDPQLRQVALAGAIPRAFNVDNLNLLLEHLDQTIDKQHAFDWLLTMPFVKQRSDGWHYHDVVRRMMLHYQRRRSPQSYRQMHTILADFYNTGRHELSASEEEPWINKQWRQDTLAYCYHHLVANPTKHWSDVINLFALAVRKRRIFAVELIELLRLDDIQDELSPEQNAMVQLFHQQLQAIRDGRLQKGLAMFDKLCQIESLSSEAKGYMLAYRGEGHRLNGQLEIALADLDAALQYTPQDARTITRRAIIYVLMESYQKALLDLNRASDLDEKDTWARAVRGETYRRIGQYDEALINLNQAIALDEKHFWAIAMRGETYRQMGLYEKALADFEHSIALDEKYTWAIERREETQRQRKQRAEASDNLNRTDLPDPTIPAPTIHSPSSRGSAYPLPPNASPILYPSNPYGPSTASPFSKEAEMPPIPAAQGPYTPQYYGYDASYSSPPIPPMPAGRISQPPIPPLPATHRPRTLYLIIAILVVLVVLVILGFIFHIL